MHAPFTIRRAARSAIRERVNTLLRTPLVAAACTPRSIDDYLELFDETWSVHEVRARIARIDGEAHGEAVSLWLSPNENWRGFHAGQFVLLTVRVAGVRYARCFSLSSAPAEPLLRLTLKRLKGGRLSGWAAHVAKRGDTVELSQAQGDFVLPEPTPPRLLFISAGSGITPVASMLHHLLGGGYSGEIACLHYARREVIFGAELAALAQRHPRLRYLPRLTRVPEAEGGAPCERFSRERLETLVPDWTDREAFVCGPAPLEAAVRELYDASSRAERLHVERFVPAVPQPPHESDGLRCRIVFARSGRVAAGHDRASLLEQAERAGLRPAYGCRMGICHTCKCRKMTGVVRNELSGQLSREPNEEIRLCVSTPCSDVTLEL